MDQLNLNILLKLELEFHSIHSFVDFNEFNDFYI